MEDAVLGSEHHSKLDRVPRGLLGEPQPSRNSGVDPQRRAEFALEHKQEQSDVPRLTHQQTQATPVSAGGLDSREGHEEDTIHKRVSPGRGAEVSQLHFEQLQ